MTSRVRGVLHGPARLGRRRVAPAARRGHELRFVEAVHRAADLGPLDAPGLVDHDVEQDRLRPRRAARWRRSRAEAPARWPPAGRCRSASAPSARSRRRWPACRKLPGGGSGAPGRGGGLGAAPSPARRREPFGSRPASPRQSTSSAGGRRLTGGGGAGLLVGGERQIAEPGRQRRHRLEIGAGGLGHRRILQQHQDPGERLGGRVVALLRIQRPRRGDALAQHAGQRALAGLREQRRQAGRGLAGAAASRSDRCRRCLRRRARLRRLWPSANSANARY